MQMIADWLGITILSTPIELTRLEAGLQWGSTVPIGNGKHGTIHLVYWTRENRGLHFDVINSHDGIQMLDQYNQPQEIQG